MTLQERNQFRKTKQWLDFRKQIAELYNNRDAITGDKLRKGWNLHHLDLDKNNYDKLIPEHFIPLNKGTHELLHRLYTFIVKAKNDRYCNMLSMIYSMRQLNDE